MKRRDFLSMLTSVAAGALWQPDVGRVISIPRLPPVPEFRVIAVANAASLRELTAQFALHLRHLGWTVVCDSDAPVLASMLLTPAKPAEWVELRPSLREPGKPSASLGFLRNVAVRPTTPRDEPTWATEYECSFKEDK